MPAKCTKCGARHRLTEVDGKVLCPDCEWKYFAVKYGLIKQQLEILERGNYGQRKSNHIISIKDDCERGD